MDHGQKGTDENNDTAREREEKQTVILVGAPYPPRSASN